MYVLVRDKKAKSGARRVAELLASALFNMLHAEARDGGRNVFGKVVPIIGDLTHPGLGLCPADLRRLQACVGLVLHCGANIDLDADVQTTLRCVALLRAPAAARHRQRPPPARC